jgi:hypothetical protein
MSKSKFSGLSNPRAVEVAASSLTPTTLGLESDKFVSGLVMSILKFFDIFNVQLRKESIVRGCADIKMFAQSHGIAAVVDSFKYCTSNRISYLYCSNEHLELPPKFLDFWKVLGVNRHMKRLLNGTSRRRMYFAHSLHMLKRNCPPLPASLVEAAVEKHRKTLTQSRESPSECKEFVSIYTQYTIAKFKTEVNFFSPLSRNSCVERSRARGGAQGEVSAFLPFKKEGRMDLRRMAIINSFAETSAKEFHNRSITDCKDKPIQPVHIRCVDDPLKSRIITVEPVMNQRLKQVTTDLNRFLRNREPFRLIGGCPVKDIVDSLPELARGHKYVSGDYSAATDNLNSDICSACAEEVSRKVPEDLRELYLQNAGMHELHYPSGDVVDQVNGQLMGSLSSFNNLSLINSALFTLARANNPDAYSDWHYVNGDDILFTATPEGLAAWKDLTMSCGLMPSFGKNYYSEDFFTINSQFFYKKVPIPFINSRLLRPFGLDKREHVIGSEGKHSTEIRPSTVGRAWRDLCNSAQVDLENTGRLRRAFLETHTSTLGKVGDILLPSGWGGCGAMTIKEAIHKLPLNLGRVRDIAHTLGGAASDSCQNATLAIESLTANLDKIDGREYARDSSRTQFVFDSLAKKTTCRTRKPCPACLSCRPYLERAITPAIVAVIHSKHLH